MPLGGGMLRKLSFGIGFGINDKPLTQANRRVDKFQDKVNQGVNNLNRLEDKARVAGRTLSTAFNKVTNTIGRGVAVLERYRYQLGMMAAAGAAAIGKMVFSAADANETINKFNVVFGEVAKQTREWADEYSSQIGRSKYATLDWLNSFQDVLVPMGLAREEAAGLSKQMVTLAADLGSFNNVPTAQAARAMQSALVGNHEAVRMLGIQLSATQLDLVAQREGYEKNFRELDNLTKMQLRFQEMIRQSSDAVGDATRTAMEFNNQWLRFKGNIKDITSGMGFGFIPVFKRGLIVINNFLERMEKGEKLETGARIFGIAVAVTALGAAIGFASAAWSAMGGFFTITNFAVAGALVGLVLLIEDLWVAFQGGPAVMTPVIDFMKDYKWLVLGVAGAITTFFAPAILANAIPAISSFALSLYTKAQVALMNFSSSIWTAITASFAFWKALITRAVTGVASFATSLATTAWSALTTFAGAVWGAVTAAWSFTAALLANPITWVVVGIVALGAAIWALWKNWDTVSAFLSSSWDWLVNKWRAGIDWVKEKFTNLFPDISMPSMPDIIGAVKNKFNTAVNWIQDNPLTVARFLVPAVNLPDIINGIYERGRQFIKKHTGIELPKIHIPTLPDLVGGIKNKYNAAKQWIKDKFNLGLPEINMPDLPNPINKIREWVGGIKTELENVDFGSALKSAIDNAMNMLPGWMQGMAKKIMNYLPQSPAKEGPLSQLDKVGPGLVNTVGQGIEKSKSTISNSLTNLWDNMMPSLGGPQPAAAGVPASIKVTGFASNGYSGSREVYNNSNTTYNQRTNQKQSSEKKVVIQNININGVDDPQANGVAVRREIEKYFDGEATSSVGDDNG